MDPAQRPRTSQDVADELHRLLTSAGEPGPYVLVGHSLGGHTIRLYTQAHADEVAGMVLIDPRLEEVARTLGASRWDTFLTVSLPLESELRYGDNPHQKAALYGDFRGGEFGGASSNMSWVAGRR